MICQVIINDFEIGRRIVYVLDDHDFFMQNRIKENIDDVLLSLQKNELFTGKTKWCDLELKHFHVMICNVLKILGGQQDHIQEDKSNHFVKRLTVLLCGMIQLIQKKTDSEIETFKISRISLNDVTYDYSARLHIEVEKPLTTSLKIVIDNEC